VSELTLDHILIQGIPDPTCFVLNCILTESPGKRKSQGITAALEHFEAVLDAPLQALRSLSYLSVLLGLLGTVFVLTVTFWEVKDIRHINPGLISHIYTVNFIAILMAALIYGLYISFRRSGDQLLLTASKTVMGLQFEVPEGVDPHLIVALEKVGRQFSQWAEDIHAKHQQHSESLVQEMRGLGEAIREMVRGMVATQRTEVEGIIPLLRSQDERVELLSQRLDERFQDLAKPLLEALPLLEAWRKRTEELKQAVQEMAQADLEGKTAALAQATNALSATINELPQAAREQFRGVKKELAAGLGQALRQSWQELMMGTFHEISSSLAALTERNQALQEAMQRLPSTMASSLAEGLKSSWLEGMEPIFRALGESRGQILEVLQHLHQTVERLPDTVKEAIAMGLIPLTKMNTELNNTLKDLLALMARLQEFPQTLAAAFQERLQAVSLILSSAVSQAIHETWQQPNPQESYFRDTLQTLLEEQRKQVQNFEKLTAQLPVALETLGFQVADKISKSLHSFLAKIGDGYLRDILGALKGLQSAIKNVPEEASTSKSKIWQIFGRR